VEKANVEPNTPAYGPLVEVCKAHGLSRTVAFDLAARKLLDTFRIGTRRYVYLESVRTLPERIAAQAGGE
jgi:hypothetical protein